MGGVDLPIVEGKYVCKISEIYDVGEGLEALKNEVKAAKKIQLTGLPDNLLADLLPLLKGKKVRAILPPGAKPSEEFLAVAEVAFASPKADIYHVYKGRKVYPGGVHLPKKAFEIVFLNGEVAQVSSLEYPKCVKCLGGTFNFAWRRSKKVPKR